MKKNTGKRIPQKSPTNDEEADENLIESAKRVTAKKRSRKKNKNAAHSDSSGPLYSDTSS